MINIVIPMAGHGIRFKDTEHEKPKPLINVFRGKTMIQLVVECLTPVEEHRFIFVCRREHDEAYDLDSLFGKITTRFEKVLVDEVTEGPACSVLEARPYIDNEQAMMTACSDDYVNIDINEFLKFSAEERCGGTIMTYLGEKPTGSTVKTDHQGLITEVAEKKIIGPQMTVGVYHFVRGRTFVEAADQMIRRNQRVHGEFYVSPVYNELIANGHAIKAYEIEARHKHSMGTPEELRMFQDRLLSDPGMHRRQPKGSALGF